MLTGELNRVRQSDETNIIALQSRAVASMDNEVCRRDIHDASLFCIQAGGAQPHIERCSSEETPTLIAF
jgi:hypothetical protein